jgi:hypothetical protein
MTIPQYFAQLDDTNVVVDIAVVTHLFMQKNPDRYPGTWIETFVDVPGKTYAGVGYTYDSETDNFIPPIPAPPIEQ